MYGVEECLDHVIKQHLFEKYKCKLRHFNNYLIDV